jgi:hypothetical protein
MEYGCSICEYTSSRKNDVIKHFSRKKSCGSGVKEIIEIPVEIKCEHCDKNFSCSISLNTHQKNYCKKKDKIKDEEIRKLKEQVKILKELEKKPTTTINNTYNIMINNYKDTDLNKLTDKILNKIITDSDAHQIIPKLIKQIHCNPDIPENHNIRISNRGKNNKYLEVYRNNQWEIEDKRSEIDNIINDRETNLSDWIDEKGENYPEAMEKFEEYLEQKYDPETANLIKQEVEILLYNNRNLTKNN